MTPSLVSVRSPPVTFFFQAEDGIRDWSVTGVQTCALPILLVTFNVLSDVPARPCMRRMEVSSVVVVSVPEIVFVRVRSEEHTSELQSLTKLVCRLLLEKKTLVSVPTSPLNVAFTSVRVVWS